MKQCNEQIALIPLPNGEFALTEIGIMAAQEDGFKRGWKAALEWVLSWETDQESREIIEKEINGTA